MSKQNPEGTQTLPKGTKRYLLLDGDTLERNTERSGEGAPAAVTVELGDDGKVSARHVSYGVEASGTVTLETFPRGHALHAYRAGFTTTAALTLRIQPKETPNE